MFLNDLKKDVNSYEENQSSVDDDFAAWHNIIMKWLNNNAPMKNKQVKSVRLPDWFTPEIIHMQKQRDNARRYRNQIRQFIRQANRKYLFPILLQILKIQKLRTVNNKNQTSFNKLSRELTINGVLLKLQGLMAYDQE